MAQPSHLLEQLLAALAAAVHDGRLALDPETIGATAAAPLLDLFSDLGIQSFALDPAHLPSQVTDDTLTITGTGQDTDLTLTFQDDSGEVAVQALFQASSIAVLLGAFPALSASFFSGIEVSGTAASVSVPWRQTPLRLASPRFGVIALSTPSKGFHARWIAPRVDDKANGSGTRGQYIELPTPTSGFRIGPLFGTWTLTDVAELISGIDIAAAFPPIIPVADIALRGFDLNLYPQAGGLSSLSLDVADASDPSKPLWTAAGGKVELTDVTVTIGLDLASDNTLTLDGTGSVEGDFMLGALALQAEVPFPLDGVWSLTAEPNLTVSVLDDIATLLDGGASQLASLLPPQLSALGEFDFAFLRLAVDASHFTLQEFTIHLNSSKPWILIEGAVEIDALSISITIQKAAPPNSHSTVGLVFGSLRLDGASPIVITFGRSTPDLPWRLDVVSPAIALPNLATLARLTNNANLSSLVEAGKLKDLRFVMTNLNLGLTVGESAALTNAGMQLQLGDGSSLKPHLDWDIIPGSLTLTDFFFGFLLEFGSAAKQTAFGGFTANGLDFDIKFARQQRQTSSTDALVAEFNAEGGTGTIPINEFLETIAPAVAAGLPSGLVVDLNNALLGYLNSGDKKFLFAVDITIEFPLSDLPLIGKALPADAEVKIRHLKLVVSSAALSVDDVTLINHVAKPVLPEPQAASGEDAIPKGLSVMAELDLGGQSILLTSPPARKNSTGLALVGAIVGDPSPDPTKWVDIQKTFGPVSIQKIGFSYHDDSLFVLANLSLQVGGLTMELLGLGAGSPLRNPTPEFTIQGIGVSFLEGPVSILGGMVGTLSPVNFAGAISVQLSEFSLTALAGYAEFQNHPSFFLYGVLNATIGGPPAFFVTGLAAGLGFNRRLVIPDVSGVASFPLVAWAQGQGAPSMDPKQPIGDQVNKALAQLAQSGVVAPSVGDYWFAAGIEFTSFEIIHSFALLTVSLGTSVEIALLGLSTLTVPPDDPSPVAVVQLALEVSFSSSSGLLAVAGLLTGQSYVLAPECRLLGGFAFYLWFSGEHSGETVLTLGGYNPNFDVPDYYPAPPRVGLNWQVTPELSINGGLYFALTTNVVMAGGRLSAVWSSGPVSAWFTYWADFLMTFKPFHYYIDGGIDLGASFTVDLGLFSLSATVHLGVQLALWGPEFAGRAIVDLDVISFTIHFNDHLENPDTAISWSDFVAHLLPQQSPSGRAMGRRGQLPAPARTADVAAAGPAAAQIAVLRGLVRALEANASGPVWLVNAETFQCAILTVVPSKNVVLSPDPASPDVSNLQWAPDNQQPHNPDGSVIAPNLDFGVGPVNIAPADFQPELTISVNGPADTTFDVVRRFSNAPKALWERKSFDAHGTPLVDPSSGLTQATISNALVGLTLQPNAPRPDRTLPVPLESLLFNLDDIETFAASPGIPPDSNPFTDQTVAGTITAPAVEAVRLALLFAIAAQGMPVSSAVDVSALAHLGGNELEAAPVLRLLGEQQ